MSLYDDGNHKKIISMNVKATILAVDDTGETFALLDILLTQQAYRIQTVESGESTLETVAIIPSGLIFTGYLPEEYGRP